MKLIRRSFKNSSAVILTLALIFFNLISTGNFAQASSQVIFSYTGAAQSWTVPSGVSSINFDVRGAQGKNVVIPNNYEALGGQITGTLTVTPNSTLYIYVGGKATNSNGGFNGGGNGGNSNGGGGGGASDIRNSSGTRLVIAGGAGGTGNNCGCSGDIGGSGGGNSGSTAPGTGGGGGGTQSSGGAGGSYPSYGSGTTGNSFTGGTGATNTNGGGGGGGYYGGGGGSWAGGGGGSSWANSTLTSGVVTNSGVQSGNGQVTITYNVLNVLVTPNAPTVTSNSPTTINVSEVSATANASSYLATVYLSNGVTVLETSTINSANITTSNQLSGLTPNVTYYVTIIAVGDGVNYSNSAESPQTQINIPFGSTSVTLALAGSTPQFQHSGTTTITATLTGANGQVTFYYNNKKIFHCVNILSSSLSAVCNWKPSIHGTLQITAALTPSSSNYSSSTSPILWVNVGARVSARNT